MTTELHPIAQEILKRKVAERLRREVRIAQELRLQQEQEHTPPPNIVDWLQEHFFIPETSQPIILTEFQIAILEYIFTRDTKGYFPFQTVLYSTIKKGGKTALAGGVARWAAETWGKFQEILCVGNDAEQAKERAFAALYKSIALHPAYRVNRKELPGRWRLLEDTAISLTTGSRVKAVATDYKGEAGANPSLTCWTELWGFIDKAALRFWAEMAPSPIRHDSMRWVETYAGYEGESELLWELYEAVVKNGRQLTAGELGHIGCFEEAPNADDPIPCYVNEAAGIFAYWDSGPNARRMPWQRGERGDRYYASEAATQTANQYIRLHTNEWVSGESAFIDISLWDRLTNPLPLVEGDKTPMVIALDAAVTGDCFGLTMGSRDPENPGEAVALRLALKWDPPKGGKIDFAGPESTIRDLCKRFNVVQVAYDPYQLEDLATRLTKESVAWFRAFSQGQDRLKSDKLFYDLIVQRRFRHDGNLYVREHIANCNAKQGRDEDSKLRLIKKSDTRHIDLAVCCSMMSAELLRLNL